MRKIISRNPFNGTIYKEFDFLTNQQLQQKIKSAEYGFQIQKKRTIAQRASIIEKLGKVVDRRSKVIAQTITEQMGKPIVQAEGEVKKSVMFCNYYSKNFEPLHPTIVKADAKKKTLVKYMPLGSIYLILPFNFPFYLNFKGGLTNLLVGNCLLTRNADSTPRLGQITQQLMNQAGFDSGQYQNIFSSPEQLDLILQHSSVGGVSFTGSSRTGSLIASKAGQHIKKSVMQLGGNDPYVVLSDANVEAAIKGAITARCRNAGQVCFSPKRFIIQQVVYEKFKKGLIQGLSKIKFGDPMNPQTQMGPMARSDLLRILKQQIRDIPSSWRITYQRQQMKDPFFPITVIEGTDESYNHEMFGPIFTLFKAKNVDHAIQIANTGTYGLGASVFSETKGQEVVDKIRCGMAFVNDFSKSDTTYPTGGVGRSGYGRQGGVEGYRQFANIRTHYEN